MVKMMWTSALALLVVVTLFGSSARAIKVCLYNDLKCNTEFACVDFDNGKCNSNKAFESTSAKVSWTCTDGAVGDAMLLAYETDDCSGEPVADESLNFTAEGGVAEDGKCYTDPDELFSFKLSDTGCGSGDCFPAMSHVLLEDGSNKLMRELELGDRVLVSVQGEYSPVIFWGHKDEFGVSGNYVTVRLGSERELTLSANHLAYVNGKLAAARTVRVGDKMTDAELGELEVLEVRTGVRAKGLYNPHTAHGDIVVDGIVVSTYNAMSARIVSVSVMHALLAVERMARQLGLSALGSMLEKRTPWLLHKVVSTLA